MPRQKISTVIHFPDNTLKVIEGDPDAEDNRFIRNPDNCVMVCETDRKTTPTVAYRIQSGQVKQPMVTMEEVSAGTTAVGYEAYCYGPCNPVGIPCPAGHYPVCTGGSLSCQPMDKDFKVKDRIRLGKPKAKRGRR